MYDSLYEDSSVYDFLYEDTVVCMIPYMKTL